MREAQQTPRRFQTRKGPVILGMARLVYKKQTHGAIFPEKSKLFVFT
jgi:hypothetical protein